MSLKRNSKLINKKFVQYLIPSILMIFALQFTSLIDGILIGNLIGSDALSASSLVMPILYVVQIPGFALGVGGSIVVANLLGKRNIEKSRKVFTISFILGVSLSTVFAILSFFVSSPLAHMFSSALADYSADYVFIYLLTDPIIAIALLIGSFMSVDNNPRLSSIFYIISNVVKIGLEILFISVFNWGMKGAAFSTAAGYLVGLVIVIFYVFNKERTLKFTFKLQDNGLKDVFKASSTSALNFFLTAVQMLIVNIVIGQVITAERDLNAYGLIANVVFVFDLLCGGVLNLIPNVCGILYGEKDTYSLKNVTRKIYFINILITAVIFVAIAIFPKVYAMAFGYNDFTDFDEVALWIRVYLLSFIPYEINKFSMNYYPTINRNLPSFVTVILREAIIVIPLTLALLYSNGLLGYSIACAVTEAATVLITYAFILIYQKAKKLKSHGIFMFEEHTFEEFDVSISNDLEYASVISEDISKFALEHHVPNRESQIAGLACEEIVANIVAYGYKKGKKNYIDVNLKINEDMLLLVIRDDGLPFDPTKYEFDNSEEYSTSGIKLIENLTDKMTYMRILNLNNTVFEISFNGGLEHGN
ncbi:MAG: ATP-binding protein [Bacilli bacterium]|nr:ATP-binding protein [Bacilli bacterium]